MRNQRRLWSRPLRVAGILVLVSAVAAVAPPATAVAANVVVTPADGADYQQPSLAWDPAHPSHLAIAYQEGNRRQVCGLARSNDGGRAWKAEVLVGPGGRFPLPPGFAACWNPAVAYGPGGSLTYVFQTSRAPDNPYSNVLVATSVDGGAHFEPPHPVDPTAPAAVPGRGGGDWWPQLGVDRRRGTVYATWSRFTPLAGPSKVLAAASTDGGRSFAAPTQASPSDQVDVGGPTPSVGPDGTLYVAWLDLTQWERGAYVDPAGLPIFPPDQLDQALTRFYAQAGHRLDFTQGIGCTGFKVDGMSYARGNRGCELPATVAVAASSDQGRTFSLGAPPGRGVDLGCRPPFNEPANPAHHCDRTHTSFYDHNVQALAAGSSARGVVAGWWQSPADGPGRLSVSVSTNGGAGWRTADAVGVGGRSNDQHRPSLSVAPDGRLDVVFYDLAPNGAQDVYRVSAPRLGSAFSAPVKVSKRPSDSSTGPRSDDDRASFGDHLAVASSAKAVFSAWTAVAPGSTHQGVVFASDPVGSSSGNAWLPWIVGLGLVTVVVLAAAVTVAARRRSVGRLAPAH